MNVSSPDGLLSWEPLRGKLFNLFLNPLLLPPWGFLEELRRLWVLLNQFLPLLCCFDFPCLLAVSSSPKWWPRFGLKWVPEITP
jgi:hypothetical protein